MRKHLLWLLRSTRASVEETSIREEDRTGMTGEKARSHDEQYIGVI